jgi:Type IV secretory system Conjugative DNA transfer
VSHPGCCPFNDFEELTKPGGSMGVFDWLKSKREAAEKQAAEDAADRARRQDAERQQQERQRELAGQEAERKRQDQERVKAAARQKMLGDLLEESRNVYYVHALVVNGRRSQLEEKFKEWYVRIVMALLRDLGDDFGVQALCLREYWQWLDGVSLTLDDVASGPARDDPNRSKLWVDAHLKSGRKLDLHGAWDPRLVYETSVIPHIPTDMRMAMEYAAGTRPMEGVTRVDVAPKELDGIRQTIVNGTRAIELLREGGREAVREKLQVNDPDGFISRLEPLVERFGVRGGLMAYVAWLFEDDIGCPAWPIIGRELDRFFDPDGRQLLARVERHLPPSVMKIVDEAAHTSSLASPDAPGWSSAGFFLGVASPRGGAQSESTRTPAGYIGEGNLLTVAPPGGGKSQCHVLPNALAYEGPMVVLDIKRSENFRAATQALDALIVDQPCLRFDPASPDQSVVYNPLEFLPHSIDALWPAAGRVAEWLCVPVQTSNDGGYFDDRARQWTRGLIAAIVLQARGAVPPVIPGISQLVDFVFDDPGAQDRFLSTMTLMEHRALVNVAKNILNTDDKERSATMNTIARSIEPWQDPVIQRLTSGQSTWRPADLLVRRPAARCAHIYPGNDGSLPRLKGISSDAGVRGEQALEFAYPRFYICMPAGDVKASTSVVRVLIGQHIDTLMEREHRIDDRPIAFLLDEFPQLGRMDSILRGVEMGRASGLRFWFFAQDLQQISRSYNANEEGAILGSCAVQSFMNINTLETAEAVSRRVGETRNVFTGGTRAALPPQDLLNSPQWRDRIICLRRQEPPLILDKGMAKDMLLPAEPAERAMEELMQAARDEAQAVVDNVRAGGTREQELSDEVLKEALFENYVRENAVDSISNFFLDLTQRALPEDLAGKLKDEFRWIYVEADEILQARGCDNSISAKSLSLLVDKDTMAISLEVEDRAVPLGAALTAWINFAMSYCASNDMSTITETGERMLDVMKILQMMATLRRHGVIIDLLTK